MLYIYVASMLRDTSQYILNSRQILRMDALEREQYGRFQCCVVFEDSISLLGPELFARRTSHPKLPV